MTKYNVNSLKSLIQNINYVKQAFEKIKRDYEWTIFVEILAAMLSNNYKHLRIEDLRRKKYKKYVTRLPKKAEN